MAMAVTSLGRPQSCGREDLYVALSGLLMSLPFPPVNLSFLAFVALVPLFIYLDKPATFTPTAHAGILAVQLFESL